ncbi:MAG: hypothetical protein QM710_08710 [Flavobacterium sp.]
MIEKEKTIVIRPYKDWVRITFLSAYFIAVLAFFILLCKLSMDRGELFAPPAFFALIAFGFFSLRQLIWMFKGRYEVAVNKSAIAIRKRSWLFNNTKTYPLDEINEVTSEDLFHLKWIKSFPLGGFYLNIFGSFKKGSKSIVVVRSDRKQTEILRMLTKEQAASVLKIISL